MTDYTKLVEQLKDYSSCRKGEIAELTADAAAAIEELQAENEKLRDTITIQDAELHPNPRYAEPKRGEWIDRIPAAPRWVRCEERLPDMEGYDWVLGVVNGECRNLKYKNAIMEVSYDPEYKEWFIDDLPEAKITVTHWMPLPEPPGEDA